MVEVNGDNYSLFCIKAKEIDDLLDNVWKDTSLYSSLKPTHDHKDFRTLISMGTKIVPYIVHLMTQKGCHWSHILLLTELVGDQFKIPDDHRGQFTRIMADWLQWYVDSPYAKHDVYFGLV